MIAAAAAMAQSGENALTVQTLKLAKFVQPDFPTRARIDGIPVGSVTAAIGHDNSGMVTDVLILAATHPAMAASAATALRQWRFQPTEEDSTHKEAPALVRVDFSVQGVIAIYGTDAGRAELQWGATAEVKSLTSLEHVPKPVVQPMPAYPADMAQRGLEGEATVAYFVDDDGNVRLPHVLNASTDEFGRAAVAAISSWRYEPPRTHGQPAIVAGQWTFQFHKNG